MRVTFELWQLITLALTIGGIFTGLGKVLLAQFEQRMTERFKALKDDSEKWQALEREFLIFRADLPKEYVRREDYIRGQSVIEAKLDAISSELKVVQIQGAKRD